MKNEIWVGNLQRSLPTDVLLEKLSHLSGETVTLIRRIDAKYCGFVEFSSHEVAQKVLDACSSETEDGKGRLTIGPEELTIGWPHKSHKVSPFF